MKYTYSNVVLKDPSLRDGLMFRIVPIVIDSDKLNEGIESAVKVPEDGFVLFSVETEDELTDWVRDILHASALFLVENDSPKDIALKIQESIRDPRKDFREEDLVSLSPRNLTIKESAKPHNPGSMNAFTEEELNKMVT